MNEFDDYDNIRLRLIISKLSDQLTSVRQILIRHNVIEWMNNILLLKSNTIKRKKWQVLQPFFWPTWIIFSVIPRVHSFKCRQNKMLLWINWNLRNRMSMKKILRKWVISEIIDNRLWEGRLCHLACRLTDWLIVLHSPLLLHCVVTWYNLTVNTTQRTIVDRQTWRGWMTSTVKTVSYTVDAGSFTL